MKKLLLPLIFLVFSPSLFAQTWLWGAGAKSGLKQDNTGFSVATDKYGNAYTTGYFNDRIYFGSDTLTSMFQDMYVAKFNSSGKSIWTRDPSYSSFNNFSIGNAIATDPSGNVYVTGQFNDTVIFGAYKLTATGSYSAVFLVKYNSAGIVKWAVQSSSGPDYAGYAVATDKSGNVFIAGAMANNITFGSINITSAARSCFFLVKYDSNGNALWGQQASNASACCPWSYGLSADLSGNIFVTGFYSGAITFGSNTLNSPGSQTNVFLAKYDANGNALWARQGGGPSFPDDSYGYGITTDRSGNAYITGQFTGNLIFGSYHLNAPGNEDIFLTKYDSAGNVVWAEQSLGANQDWTGYSLSSDAVNHIYLACEGTGDTIRFHNYSIPSCLP